MSDGLIWEPLDKELARWQAAGRVAQFWWRDDDVIAPSKALDGLLDLSGNNAVPLTLAAIPAFAGEALAARLSREPHVLIAVHGWSHDNHAAPEEKKQELGHHRLVEVMLGELYKGLHLLKAFYPDCFVPMLVPPWNRIDKALTPQLSALGFACLSVYGRAEKNSVIPLINTHVDIMDWHGTRGARPQGELVAALVEELQNRFGGNGEPIGLLSHHLVHDAAAWDFLKALFEVTARHPAVAWKSSSDLLKA
jgi:hypothetical protein